jgi:deoxyribodipyrimidine photo-lyase
MNVQPERIRTLNDAPIRDKADYVLYWCQSNRRTESNHALACAADLANQVGLPLLVYEGLTCSYPQANDRLHTFILEAVPERAKALKRLGAGYFFYLRARKKDPDDLLYKLAANARCVVTDDFPVFVPALYNSRVPQKIGIPYLAVDSSCIVPMNAHEKRAWAAFTIRPKMQRELPDYLKPVDVIHLRHPWRDDLLPKTAKLHRTEIQSSKIPLLVASCEINHTIQPSITYTGGTGQAHKHLQLFIEQRLRRYAKESNQPSNHATSELSPYLHFGHISSLEVALTVEEYAKEHRLLADRFLEELIVRRELAFNFARFAEDVQSLDALPDWCRRTMAKHGLDERTPRYTAAQLEKAETYDALWNAAQKELLLRGRIHGYYRMYWGKKIIEWSQTYEQALRVMIHLHDVYALDGRDPNTYTNILWCFGLHDRPWKERPIFGQLRYMSLDGMTRKTDVEAYVNEITDIERTGKDPFRI